MYSAADERNERVWTEWYDALRRYKREHGHCIVPQRQPGGLGKWVANVRARGKIDRVSPRRLALLDRIGFVWNVKGGHQWEVQFAELAAFREEHGHANVPQKMDRDARRPRLLGRWLDKQRQSRKAGTLSAERERRLEGLGIVWQRFDDMWERQFRRLVRFEREHGHCVVPRNYDGSEHLDLRLWVDNQRQNYNRRRKRNHAKILSAERIKRLESIGFCWDAWEQRRISKRPPPCVSGDDSDVGKGCAEGTIKPSQGEAISDAQGDGGKEERRSRRMSRHSKRKKRSCADRDTGGRSKKSPRRNANQVEVVSDAQGDASTKRRQQSTIRHSKRRRRDRQKTDGRREITLERNANMPEGGSCCATPRGSRRKTRNSERCDYHDDPSAITKWESPVAKITRAKIVTPAGDNNGHLVRGEQRTNRETGHTRTRRQNYSANALGEASRRDGNTKNDLKGGDLDGHRAATVECKSSAAESPPAKSVTPAVDDATTSRTLCPRPLRLTDDHRRERLAEGGLPARPPSPAENGTRPSDRRAEEEDDDDDDDEFDKAYFMDLCNKLVTKVNEQKKKIKALRDEIKSMRGECAREEGYL